MAKYANRGKRTFSEREKRAYSAGRGYGAAKAGRGIKCQTEKEKQSFRNGVNSVDQIADKGRSRNHIKNSHGGSSFPLYDFDYTEKGYIKGHYVDGKFEPN